jgi:hypothetical protein
MSAAIVTQDPECRTDQDCDSKLACANEICYNPCQVDNPCLSGQECTVQDSSLKRIVACRCPAGYSVAHDGCMKGKMDVMPKLVLYANVSFQTRFSVNK